MLMSDHRPRRTQERSSDTCSHGASDAACHAVDAVRCIGPMRRPDRTWPPPDLLVRPGRRLARIEACGRFALRFHESGSSRRRPRERRRRAMLRSDDPAACPATARSRSRSRHASPARCVRRARYRCGSAARRGPTRACSTRSMRAVATRTRRWRVAARAARPTRSGERRRSRGSSAKNGAVRRSGRPSPSDGPVPEADESFAPSLPISGSSRRVPGANAASAGSWSCGSRNESVSSAASPASSPIA